VLVNEVGEGHEFLFVELAIMVLVELIKHLFRLRHFRRTVVVAIRAIVSITIMVAFVAVFAFARAIMPRTGIVTVTSLTVTIAHQRAHFFAGSLALIVAEFAVAVFIEFFQQLFADFGPGAALVFFGVVIGRIGGHCRHGQQAHSRKNKTCKQIPHVVSTFFRLVSCGPRDST
jgi:hypothetical protein